MPASSQPSYAVVVAGNMNPAIHHPSWYRSCALLSESDEDFSVKSRTIVLLPDFAQFTTPSLHINCTLEKWSVTANPLASPKLALEVTRGTFERLSETPITAFGLNVAVVRELPAERADAIARRFRRGPFAQPFCDIEGRFEQLTMTYTMPRLDLADKWLDRTVRASVTFLVKPASSIQVTLNAHHQIGMVRPERFDLGPMLDAASAVYGFAASHADLLINQALED
jgi:hypothetical protein